MVSGSQLHSETPLKFCDNRGNPILCDHDSLLMTDARKRPKSAPRRTFWRGLRLAAVWLVVVGTVGLSVLLAITPSVGTAETIVKADAEARGIAYPGPMPPTRFVNALVATEDQRFFSPLDPGVDVIAIMRVIFGRLAGFPDQGGSTINRKRQGHPTFRVLPY